MMATTIQPLAKDAETRYPINDLLRRRWSSRAFADEPVSDEVLGSLFEAARWAPSTGNGQPWSFVVNVRERDPEGFERALAVLNESNRIWVQHAPVLIFAITRRIREDGREHGRAQYDLGLAVKSLVVQATDLGLIVRQMAGFDTVAARETFDIPAGYDPIAAIAVGYPGAGENLSEELREREAAPRERKPLESFVFGGRFGETYEGLEPAERPVLARRLETLRANLSSAAGQQTADPRQNGARQ
jgi:nitroreductase